MKHRIRRMRLFWSNAHEYGVVSNDSAWAERECKDDEALLAALQNSQVDHIDLFEDGGWRCISLNISSCRVVDIMIAESQRLAALQAERREERRREEAKAEAARLRREAASASAAAAEAAKKAGELERRAAT